MPNPNTTTDTEQYIQNKSFDANAQIAAVLPVEYDGNSDPQLGLRKAQSKLQAKKIYDDSSGNVYVCAAPIGTAQATAGWQCKKINDNGSGTIVVTWADGNAAFDNVATDPTALSYS